LRISAERLTPAAREVVSLAGIQESFGKAARRTLLKLTGLRLSESTVERTTEAAGTYLGERLQTDERFGPNRPYAWNRDARGKSCAYVSVDATGILMQGEHGSKIEGRMVTVGMIYNPQRATRTRTMRRCPSRATAFAIWRVCTISTISASRCVGKERRSGWTRPTSGSR
jgi:hypothetical protein